MVLLLEELYQDDLSFNNVYVTLVLILFYMVLIIMDYNKILYKQISAYLLIVICAAEAFINSSEESSYKPTTYSAYLEDNQAIEEMVEKVESEDTGFFRIEKLNRRQRMMRHGTAIREYLFSHPWQMRDLQNILEHSDLNSQQMHILIMDLLRLPRHCWT